MLHSPLTLFHASFLPICSTFSHLSLLILHHFFPACPPTLVLSEEQDPQALVGAARVCGARPGERRRRQGAAAVRSEGNGPRGPHRHRKRGRRGQVEHTESMLLHAYSINHGRVFVSLHHSFFFLSFLCNPTPKKGSSFQATSISTTCPTRTSSHMTRSWRGRRREKAGGEESCWLRSTSAGTRTARASAHLFTVTPDEDKKSKQSEAQQMQRFSVWQQNHRGF